MSQKSHEPQAEYFIERMEGSADETDANPLDLSNYHNNFELAEIERLRAEITQYRAALARLTRPQEGQGEAGVKNTGKSISDFTPVCLHHFDYFPARNIWLYFRCLHCGLSFDPDEICKMLDAGKLGGEA